MTLATPPLWAEALLRTLLSPRDRDTISGDLLEEYRENAIPRLGAFRARLWYLRQLLSLATLRGMKQAVTPSTEPSPFATPLLWAAAAGIVELVIVILTPRFNMPFGTSFFILATTALGIAGVTAIRSRQTARFLWRCSWFWGLLFAATVSATIVAEIFEPWFLSVSAALIFIAAGFAGTWRTERFRTGVLLAMAAAVIGSTLAIVIVTVGAQYGYGLTRPHPPIVGIFPVALGVSIILGAIGAIFARGPAAQLARPPSITRPA